MTESTVELKDISGYQDITATEENIDFVKMYNEGIKYLYIRYCFGVTKDKNFDYAWKASAQAGIKRGAYVFPVRHIDINLQQDFIMNGFKSDIGELPMALDYEQYVFKNQDGTSSNVITKIGNLKYLAQNLDEYFKRFCMLYTGYYTWKDYGGWNDSFWAKHPLWLAWYAEKFQIPSPWKKVTMHQYSKNGDGKKYGVESLGIDEDRFFGTEEELLELGKQWDNTSTNILIDDNDEISFTTTRSVNRRTGPGTQYKSLGLVPSGTEVKLNGIGGNDVWVKDSDGSWICKEKDGIIYLD